MKFLCASIATVLIMTLMPTGVISADDSLPPEALPQVLISEIQSHGRVDGSNVNTHEFVELYNNGADDVSLDGWKLEFANATGSVTRTVAQFTDNPEAELLYEVTAAGFFVVSHASYIADAGFFITSSSSQLNQTAGTVTLFDALGNEIDKVGYGSTAGYKGNPAPALSTSQSVSRCFDNQNEITNTGDNSVDFIINPTPLPGGGIDCPKPEEVIVNECQGLIISEIGANLDKQFVEVYNSGDEALQMEGCQLQTNRSATKSHVFPERTLSAGDFYPVFIADTELTLTKTTTGTVYILSSDDAEVDEQYYANLKKDTSWAWFGGNDWRQTYATTPGTANKWQEFPACPEGQVRNPETGRCRNIVTATSTLVPCGPGQERNPATNRCRSIASSTRQLVPCKPGQERNPETNRCRAVAGVSTLKPCAPDQERNPETNRCRKITGSTGSVSGMDVQDVEVATTAIPAGWWLAGFTALFAAGYAVWEWRYELSVAVKQKLPTKTK